MKPVVIFLVLLAAIKLGHHEYLFRTSTRDAVIAAYKERAAQACQKNPKSLGLALAPQSWANPTSVSLAIGKSTVDVYLWQLDNAMWAARYRNPYLLFSVGQRAGTVYCEYDIVNSAASVYRL